MQHATKHDPGSSVLQVALHRGEALLADPRALYARSTSTRIQLVLVDAHHGGFFRRAAAVMVALLRRLLGRPAFAMARIEAQGGGWVWLAPEATGEVRRLPIGRTGLVVRQSALLASTTTVALVSRGRGIPAIWKECDARWVEATGAGELFVAGEGALLDVEVDGELSVESSAVVAYEGSVSLEDRDAPVLGVTGEASALPSAELRGRGRALLQTRRAPALSGWLEQRLA